MPGWSASVGGSPPSPAVCQVWDHSHHEAIGPNPPDAYGHSRHRGLRALAYTGRVAKVPTPKNERLLHVTPGLSPLLGAAKESAFCVPPQGGGDGGPLTLRDSHVPGLVTAGRTGSHDDALPSAAGWRGYSHGIWAYQDPCKALQRLVTRDRMRTPPMRQSNANDRYPTKIAPGRGTSPDSPGRFILTLSAWEVSPMVRG